MPFQPLMVTITCPNVAEARTLAVSLVEMRLAACVQIVPAIESIYRWQGAIETAEEVLLLVKTSQSHWPELSTQVKSRHSYEVPEIVAVPISEGSPEYLAWMEAEVS